MQPDLTEAPTLQDILAARTRIAPHIRRTPILRADRIAPAAGCRLYLKPETLQITGAFKLRGALNTALQLSPEQIARGFISSSSGNHAQGLSYAARMLSTKVLLVLPVGTPALKVENTRALGAEVILFDGDNAARWREVYRIAAERGYEVIHGFEDPRVMAGQGTIGCEILEDLPEVETVLVPLGGGGLISGVATAIKAQRPKVRVVGCEPALTPKYHRSRAEGRRVSLPLRDTIADGLRISVPGRNPWPIIERHVDEIVLVGEEDIVAGMKALASDAKLIAEPAAAIAIGALLGGAVSVRPDETVCAILTGGNWGLADLARVFGASGPGS